ncbi:UNKNOWN [Stylonychia lemnae]|uniref:Oxidoreductase-like domain-containing protein n=1 Tax=Stylonychia lemnae TaxID=5949 RepID=A0A078B6B2_STYLE|nr:UNKNOWN [Stylonychia lemnae]|eukprot:CDW89088.1 UNKNOWN [Stylonychia lemnae]
MDKLEQYAFDSKQIIKQTSSITSKGSTVLEVTQTSEKIDHQQTNGETIIATKQQVAVPVQPSLSKKQKKIKDIEDLINRLREPREPDQDECCGNGCTPCVFDTYYDRLGEYQDKKDDYQSKLLDYEEMSESEFE